MIRSIALIVLGLTLALPSPTTARQSVSNERANAAMIASARAIDQLLQENDFQGAFIIASADRPLLAEAYGFADRDRTIPATTDTPYWCASVAKNFTAAAILTLVDTGKLALDDPIADYLDVPEAWTMTIAQLMDHTSGIRQNYAADGIANSDSALHAIFAMPLAAPPGEGWQYSNDAYSVLGILVEKVSGQSYETYVAKNIFEPAGMRHSGFWAIPPPGVAQLPDPSYDQRMGPDWGYRGGHGIATSAQDLYRWWLALQTSKVLTRKRVDLMLAPQAKVRDGLWAGYGWFVQETPGGNRSLWTRGTDQSNENGILLVLPKFDFVIIGLSNHEGDRDPITRRMADKTVAIFETEIRP